MSTGRDQRGVVLIIALVFLLVLSVAGLSAMRLANVEERMTASFSGRGLAFQAAEAALVEAERYLDQRDFSATELALLFSSGCINGLCFNGAYSEGINGDGECTLTASAAEDEVFQNRSLWLNSGPSQTLTLEYEGREPVSAAYLIEFRCFVPVHPEADATNQYNSGFWRPQFRITAYAAHPSRLLLQSTYLAAGDGRQSWREVPIRFAP